MGSVSASPSTSLFTGTSRYSQDFQSAIDRATQIASLPMSQMGDQITALNSQTKAMTDLDTPFKALQSAVAGIGSALNGSTYDAAISDDSKLSVTLGDQAGEGNYTVEVTNAGVYAASRTASTWVNTPGAPSHYQVSIGGVATDLIMPANSDNSASSVAAAINSQFGDKVRANVVEVGGADASSLRISLQANALGDLDPDILLVNGTGASATTTSLQGYKTTGALAHYIVGGVGAGVDSATRTVTISPGVTVTLKATGVGQPVNITVTRSTSALVDALKTFVTAYNSTVDMVDKQHGQTGGALTGQSLVGDLSRVLGQVATYAPTSGLYGLKNLAVELDPNGSGHLSFNAYDLMSLDFQNSAGVTSFLGVASSTGVEGSGFLKAATDLLNGVEDADTGLLPAAETHVTGQVTDLTNKIADQQTKVDNMKESMTARMAAADALIATMEQQYSYLSSMFAAMQTADQQYK